MKQQTYVIGHRNPDTDSVASALAYAEFKRLAGEDNVTAAMAGSLNPQTKWVLERLGVTPPLYLADVHPKVRDVVVRTPVTVAATDPLMKALQLFHHNGIRILPVVDTAGAPVGVIPLIKIADRFLRTGPDSLRVVSASLDSLAACLEGNFLAGQASLQVEQLRLVVGAMNETSFATRLTGFPAESLVVITGDRPSIHRAAIAHGVRLLVVTGGLSAEPEVVELAKEKGVAVLSTPLDTAAALSLARLATLAGELADPHFESVGVGEPLGRLRQKLKSSGEAAVLALEDDGALAGVATKSTLFAPIPYSLILVDHNELVQAVPGAEELEILEVIDHHKLGNPPTSYPIKFVTAPVGSTCTLVATLYRDRGLTPDATTASLLLAGVLSDTVILKSPTTSERDRATVEWLAGLAGLDWQKFGAEIFAASGALSGYGGPLQIVRSDFKHFSQGDLTFGVGQVEVFGFDEFHAMKADLRQALASVRAGDKLEMAGLMVTDIATECTLFLVDGGAEYSKHMGYPRVEPQLYEMQGVMSRKKQLVPHLIKVLGAL
ncbi:putative manganese-dependent inorganic diphosphatase [Geomesophilobacter sediminis]|uniref:inorganic diphosphatase n=1 Tax=Geomesophilobacter sediminis TaxID=2798584 RepID=A0A8J7SDL6_9BACT|nr:putative manganese-dependent inorganic diphosphatase [Geomesophilobacter sediminis]MBJ6727889.1 putative manganese-dependent inorganic diphosphatase [Geomesophilobacter sediminis]